MVLDNGIVRLLWKANRNSYALYRMALFPVTLGYLD